MKDETAAFIILGFIVIAFSISIGFCEYQKYIKISETNSNVNIQETNKIDYYNNVNVNEYSTLTNIVSQEDLKEINEKDKNNTTENNIVNDTENNVINDLNNDIANNEINTNIAKPEVNNINNKTTSI